ncbi:MAG: filamentous hemagglutinin N-terminal domain-containing protein [Nitrosomonadales bacterium]|nr:filamentous hemagglutinin N-terminal domain-containing protein [Nitrosomonadales bacterium]
MNSLNHIFRTIWSEALSAWIAVSEITKTKGKRSGSCLFRALHIGGVSDETDDVHSHRFKPIIIALACCFALNAQANPTGGTVVNGNASFNNSGNTLTITNTPGTIINWQGFSIGVNEVTHFAQQSAASAVLNRVVTSNPSAILGTLSSNGQVYLVNPNGIVFGSGATVDVAGLVATSLNLSNADFLAGRHNYTNQAGAQNISNAGNINAQQGGQIYLIAPNVENTGIITAPNGEILLAAGYEVQLVNSLDPSLRVSIVAPAGEATNLGQLIVQSGSLGLFGAVVRNTGAVSADSATMQGGKIVFKSSLRTEVGGTVSASGVGGGEIHILSDMQNGTVEVSGTLDASAPIKGDGGFIDTSAAQLQIGSTARITSAAPSGKSGEWLIDPYNVNIGSTTGSFSGGFVGGVWTPTGSASYVNTGTIASTLGGGTSVTISTVNPAGTVDPGNITVNQSILKTTGTVTTTLTLLAENDIIFIAGAGISSTSGALNVVLRSDADANGTGTVSFAGANTLNVLAGGRVDLYYNPASYATPTTFTGITWGATAHTEWMLVNNVTNLQDMNTNLAGNYALGTDINAAGTTTWNFNGTTYDGFAPVGTIATPFTGNFNGNLHTIDGLYINRSSVGYVGLFGYTNASTIKDVSLTNVNILGGGYVGSLVGWHQGSLANSHNASGTVTSVGMIGTAAGGLVGMNYNFSTVDNCSAGSTVSGTSYVGGLIGASQQSTLSNVSATGNVTGTNWGAGGLVGSMEGDLSPHSLTNGTASGNVNGSRYVGGLVGWNGYWSTINNGIASGNVSSTLTDAGGLVGMNAYNIISSHATGNVLGVTNVGGLVGNNYWDNNPSFSFTYGSISLSDASIGTVTGVTNVGGLVGSSSSAAFNAIDTNNASGNVLGTTNVGGLVGYFSGNTSVVNSFASGNVTGNGATNANLGGLVGQMNGGTISNSYSTSAAVAGGAGSSYVGGLTGFNAGTISNSYASGVAVSGGNMVGGLVGSSTWTISGSYVTTGSVTGTSNYGGLVGGLALNGSLSNSHYNINGVTINGANIVTVGGLYNDNTASFNGVGQYTDWLVNGNKSLNIANYTSPYGSFGNGGANIYTISNAQGLKDMLGFSDNSLYTFTLTADVDLAGFNDLYIPILAGTFDGAGFTVFNLNLNQANSNTGLFGHVFSTGSVSNLSLVNATVNASLGDHVGALVGWNQGTINNNSVSAGVAGSVVVTGAIGVGGLVGYNTAGAISNSFVDGASGTLTVTGTTDVGGLAGLVTVGSISNSHVSAATVAGATAVGGLVGYSAAAITNSYVDSGAVTASAGYIGGLVGQNLGTLVNSHFDIEAVTTNGGNNVTVGGLYNTGGTGQYSAWFNGGALTPLAIGNYSSTLVLQGDGSYGIGTQQGMKDMLAFADDPALYNFSLTAGINLTGMAGYYVPVLAGDFNGNAFTISNLSLGLPNDNVGLFGTTNGSLVSNLTLSNASVAGLTNVGVVAGSNYANISSVFVTGVSAVSGQYAVGGLVGYNGGGNIFSSAVTGGTVTGTVAGSRIGGLVGYNNGIIDTAQVLNTAVSGSASVGGLVGYNLGSTLSGVFVGGGIVGSTVTNGSVTGTGGITANAIGGLVGTNMHGEIVGSSVVNPTVDGGSGAAVGGLVGYNNGSFFNWPALHYSISNSFVSSGTVNSLGNEVGGLVGNNFGAPINTSYVDSVTVSGGRYVGGFVGFDGGEGWAGGLGLISNSFVTNTQVTGTWEVGGFAGGIHVPTSNSISDNFLAITNSYVSGGTVSGTSSVGGLVGFNDGEISMTYTASGLVSGTTNVGGLIGYNDVSAVVSNSFWDIDTTGQGLGAGFGQDWGYLNTTGVAGLTTLERMTMSSFTGWNIANTGGAGMTWRIYEGRTGPLLTSFLTPTTLTANDDAKTYDGIAYSGGAGFTTSAGVAVNGGFIMGSYGGTAQGAVNAGSYTISVSGMYSDQFGFDITVYTDGTLTINSAALTLLNLAANDASKTYGTTLTFSGTEFTPVGLVGGDTITGVTLTSAGAVNTANAGTYSINVTPGSEVFGQGLASNYTITYVNGVLTVNPALLTLSAVTDSKVYDGTTSSAVAVNVSGLVLGTVTGLTQSFGNKNVLGAGLSTLSVNGGYTVNDGNGGLNYTVTTNTATGSITPLSVTLTAPNLTRTYDGSLGYTTTGADLATLSGALVGGDVVNAASFSFADKNAGAGNKTVLFNSVALNDGNGGGNYFITRAGNATSTINQENLIVAAMNLNKVLGTPDPTLSYLLFGLHDPVATTLSGSLARNAGDTIGTYSINQGSLTLLDTTNYYMTYVPGVFTILAPTVVQEITEISLLNTPKDEGALTTEEEEKRLVEQLAAAGMIDADTGATLTEPLPLCR